MVTITLVTRSEEDAEDDPERTFMVSRVPCKGEWIVLDARSYVVDDVAQYTFALVHELSEFDPVAMVWAVAETEE